METREFSTPPGLLPLYGRAVLPKRGGSGGTGGTGAHVPQRRLVLPDVPADRDRLRRYAAVCGFSDEARLPVTYPHVVAFPLAMALMTARDFPFPVLGLVHLANRIEQLRPVGPHERLTYVVEAAAPQPHPKGTTFAVEARARRGGETVWRESSTYLRRGRRTEGAGAGGPGGPAVSDLAGAKQQAGWNLPGWLGRSYAAVSGDRNPIHLHPLAARLFGFPRAIAHGMWTKARCLAALAEQLPDAYAVRVDFRAPVLLPAAVRFRADPADPAGGDDTGAGTWAFDLTSADGGREHLRGSVSALA